MNPPWTRASLIAVGSPLPYVLRMGRGVELIEDGTVILRVMIDIGMERVMHTDTNWIDERQVPIGSTQQEVALQELTAALAEQLKVALHTYAANAAGR